MKKLMLLIVLLTAATVNAVDLPVRGIVGGTIISEDSRPYGAAGFVNDFSTGTVGGKLFNMFEFSFLKSNRPWDKASELYVNRDFVLKVVQLNDVFYTAVGAGTWLMLNTGGPDIARLAGRAAIGAQFMGLHANLSGEFVHIEGPNWYFISATIVITDLP